MDQIKIGAFLKTLRKEKNLTQEQAAERLCVSNRTVSRWETGTNMPDISLLWEIAELSGDSIPELIEGERKSEKKNEEAKEVAARMSDYAETEKTTILKNITTESLLGVCALVVLMVLELLGIRSFSQLTEVVFLYCQVFVYVSVVMVFLHASGLLYKFKRRDRESSLPKPFLFLIALAAAAAVAFGIWFLVSLIGG
ncbi:MAG: helix-turn-helix transcriptional regulator [Oscillospiraceae bacterium]|nr:helix-turn-helix transcriptional regulator [Oscillospiraceae bacterium]